MAQPWLSNYRLYWVAFLIKLFMSDSDKVRIWL